MAVELIQLEETIVGLQKDSVQNQISTEPMLLELMIDSTLTSPDATIMEVETAPTHTAVNIHHPILLLLHHFNLIVQLHLICILMYESTHTVLFRASETFRRHTEMVFIRKSPKSNRPNR